MKKRYESTERDFSAAYILVIVVLVAIVALLVVVLGPAKPAPTFAGQPSTASPSQSDLALELMAQNPNLSASDAQSMAGKALYQSFLTGKDARLLLQSKIEKTRKGVPPAQRAALEQETSLAGQALVRAAKQPLRGCPKKTSCQNNKLYQQPQVMTAAGLCQPTTDVAAYEEPCPQGTICNTDRTACVKASCPPNTTVVLPKQSASIEKCTIK